MGFWSHLECGDCFEGSEPAEATEANADQLGFGCCSCGRKVEFQGWIVRRNPNDLLCQGMSKFHIDNDKKTAYRA